MTDAAAGDDAAAARLLELAHDAILVRDAATGAIRFWNRGAETLYGWSRAEALGRVGHALLRTESPRPLPELERELAETGEWEGELVHTARDGRRLVVLSRWALERDAAGVPRACLEINRDITRRRRLEERQRFLAAASRALAASLDYEATLRTVAGLAVPALADGCGVGVWGPGAARALAWSMADPARAEAAAALQRRYPLGEAGFAALAAALGDGGPLLLAEVGEAPLVRHARDGAHLALLRALGLRSALLAPLRARDRTTGFLALLQADSGRRFGPEDRDWAADLAARCALAVENARLYQEAQAALRARDAFLSSAAHDLRGPLGAIRGFAQLLRQRAGAAPALAGEEVGRYLEPIERGAARLAAQIEELRDLARLPAGEALALRRGPTDLVALAHLVAAEQGRSAPRHRLRVEAAEAALVGDWDEGRLHRALTNLVENAIAYSPAGGPVTLALAREGAWAVVRVADRGIGIAADELPRVFDRYFRGERARALGEGTGVGLASVRETAERHGGTVEMESAEGEGTTVILRLPLGR